MDRMQGFSFDPSKMSKAAAEEYSTSDSEDEEDEFLMPSTDPTANEFADYNPRKRRRTGRDAKESAALGIFGSESEDEGPSRRWKRKALRKKGVSFVSSGAKARNSDEEDEDEEEEEEQEEAGEYDEQDTKEPGIMKARPAEVEDEDEDDYEEEAVGIGLGFGAPGGHGLGFAPPTQRQLFTNNARDASKPPTRSAFDGTTPLGRGFVPSSAMEPVLQVNGDETEKPQIARPSAFSGRPGRGGKGKLNPNSFGARMMAKMGYKEGQGLGKEGQGRNIVIEANLRPQKVGLGAVKELSEQEKQEQKRQRRLRGEVVPDSDEEEEKRKKAARRKKALAGGISTGGPSSGASTPRRQKPKYMTMDEVKKAAPGLNIPEAFTPILDLTGPGKKMLTSSSGLMTPTSGVTTETVEQAESRKLVRRAQNDFMAILEEWQSLQNRKAYAELQIQQEKQELEELDSSLEGHRAMTNAFAELSVLDGAGEWQQRWQRTIAILKSAAEKIPEESAHAMKDDLASITVAALYTVFKQALEHWNPLEEPNPPLVADLKSIENLLGLQGPQGPVKHHQKSTATPYETMMYKMWLPHVSRAVREWNVRDCDQLLSLYEAWRGLLPGFVRTQLLEQDLTRKLDDAIAKWEPKRRKQHNLPHTWLFPWLQYLPSYHLDPRSSNGLVAEVKRKFRQLIDVWEFYRGVIPGLEKWKSVLRPPKGSDEWRPLVMNHVLPSMARYVRAQFQVDPWDQEPYLEVITGEFQWLDIISPTMIAEVMVAEVFPTWHEVLYRLLTADSPNYEEIAQWYSWWAEEVFPEQIRSLPSIAAEFEKGIVMINEALDLGDRAQAELQAPRKGPAFQAKRSSGGEREGGGGGHRHQRHRRHETATEQATPKQEEPEEMSIRHFVEDWCENNDLQFIPERKKVHAEGPLYRITARGDGRGGVLAYFKGIRLYAETKKGPVEIRVDRESDWTHLLELAQ